MQVFYFNGKSSKKHSAELYFYDSKWVIAFTNSQNIYEEVFWDLNKISKAEHIGSNTLFKYDVFPKASIEFIDVKINKIIEEKYPERFFNTTDTFINQNSKKHYLTFTLVLVATIFFIYQFIMPLGGKIVFSQIPETYDEELGDKIYLSLKEGMEEDSIASIYANQFAKTINFNSKFPIKIHVINDNVINAYALPGGHIVVYSSLLKKMNTPESFAALLSHEAVHVKNRHSMQNISKQLAGYLFLSILINDANGMQAILLENINSYKNLDYSRTLEKEADIDGLDILLKNKINQYGYIQLFNILNSEVDEEESILSFLSTHPKIKERISYTLEISKKQLPSQMQANANRKLAWEKLKSKINNENIEHAY
jgi:predicted Zn-dependent protease